MKKTERFGMVLSPVEKATGMKRAGDERLSLSAYIRRLMRLDAKQYGLLPSDGHDQPQAEAERGDEVRQ